VPPRTPPCPWLPHHLLKQDIFSVLTCSARCRPGRLSSSRLAPEHPALLAVTGMRADHSALAAIQNASAPSRAALLASRAVVILMGAALVFCVLLICQHSRRARSAGLLGASPLQWTGLEKVLLPEGKRLWMSGKCLVSSAACDVSSIRHDLRTSPAVEF
jgi:hypothetical protein